MKRSFNLFLVVGVLVFSNIVSAPRDYSLFCGRKSCARRVARAVPAKVAAYAIPAGIAVAVSARGFGYDAGSALPAVGMGLTVAALWALDSHALTNPEYRNPEYRPAVHYLNPAPRNPYSALVPLDGSDSESASDREDN